ncbi:hypothetical protein [Verminephrobacter eiseniae]|uniref:hypothetical protein n=1 Tax=Verminephrobacter eiseniae TaxID=364317 RepID=UPI00223814C3|nr:hypothetical protein [Verminephrobacter eiseniae]
MTHHDIFDSLTRNAFDFLEHGIAELDKVQKYSVIHFYAVVGMLLKLKARLMMGHGTMAGIIPDLDNFLENAKNHETQRTSHSRFQTICRPHDF